MLRLPFNLLCVCVLLVAGCTGPIELSDEDNTAEVAQNDANSATPAANETGSAGADSGTQTAPPSEPTGRAEPTGPAEPMTQDAPPQQPQPKKGVIGQTTAQVVDAKEWLKKPGIQAKDGNLEGVDPFSRAASGYFTLAAQTSTLGLQQSVQHYKALNDKFPSYEEFMRMMQENRIEFTKLRWYEIYAYNEDTGKILVLEDTVAKEEGP